MICSKYTLPLLLFQISINSIQSRHRDHYLYRLYKKEITILENGTFPKRDYEKLERYKQDIVDDEQLFRFKAWLAMNEDSRLYDEISTKCYDRFKSRKRKKSIGSDEKWEKRVRFHFLQNFLLQNGYFLERRNQHSTHPTTKASTFLMLPYSSDKIIPNLLKKILPSNVFYKYYLPLRSIIRNVPGRFQTLVKTYVNKFKSKSEENKIKEQSKRNRTVHRYLMKIERTLNKLEQELDKINSTKAKPSKSKIKLLEQLRRKRRKKRFKKLLKKINCLFPVEKSISSLEDLEEPTTKFVTRKPKKKRVRTTRKKRNITRTTRVISKKKRRKEEKRKNKAKIK